MATFKEVKGSYNKGLGYIKKGEKRRCQRFERIR